MINILTRGFGAVQRIITRGYGRLFQILRPGTKGSVEPDPAADGDAFALECVGGAVSLQSISKGKAGGSRGQDQAILHRELCPGNISCLVCAVLEGLCQYVVPIEAEGCVTVDSVGGTVVPVEGIGYAVIIDGIGRVTGSPFNIGDVDTFEPAAGQVTGLNKTKGRVEG